MADLLRSHTPLPSAPARLRALLAAGSPVLAPGAFDALSARLVEQAGFESVYMTGFGTTASLLGRPDVGLLGGAEMAGNVRRLVQAIEVPLIADADTGYGNAINVVRTVQDYEQAGVAGLHIEDQILPKRCGHMDGKQVVPLEEMVGKVEAAAAARRDPDLVLIARTDARAMEGLDAAITRARAYRAAGADLLFVEALQSVEEIEIVARELADEQLVFNWAEGGKTPPLPHERLAELGFALVLMPITTLLAATRAMQQALAELRVAGTPLPVLDRLPAFDEFLDLIGLPEVRTMEMRFGLPVPAQR
ncbi:MAG: carboxyvinyl-carboxyphosphonate phosphorylmutase [Ilumatobacteraceae bacterium]|nr:carboxyvinyl-carboxyphosphonate phosphorylmutase [Ilumatobacteraceae bacterium]